MDGDILFSARCPRRFVIDLGNKLWKCLPKHPEIQNLPQSALQSNSETIVILFRFLSKLQYHPKTKNRLPSKACQLLSDESNDSNRRNDKFPIKRHFKMHEYSRKEAFTPSRSRHICEKGSSKKEMRSNQKQGSGSANGSRTRVNHCRNDQRDAEVYRSIGERG